MFLKLTWEASIDAGKAREQSGLEVVTASRSGQLGGSSQKFFERRGSRQLGRAAAGWSGVDFMEPRKSRAALFLPTLDTYPLSLPSSAVGKECRESNTIMRAN